MRLSLGACRMRLNLGCGDYAAPGWTNVDRHDAPGVDVIGSITQLPFADASAELVYAGHVLEHLTYDEQLPAALREIRRVLAADGTLMVVGPDIDRAHRVAPEWVERIWPGPPADLPGKGHAWCSTVEDTLMALVGAGFNAVEQPVRTVGDPWPIVSHAPWQLAVKAVIAGTTRP